MNYFNYHTTKELHMGFDWLNKDARTFLSRGYLGKGQSAEDRIREIAEKQKSFWM